MDGITDRGALRYSGGANAGGSSTDRAEVMQLVRHMYKVGAAAGGVVPASRLKQVERAIRILTDVRELGFEGLKLKNLGARHVAKLVELWRDGKRGASGDWERRPLSRGSAANMWTVLQRICVTLDKPSIVKPFAEVWPVADESALPRGKRGDGPADLDEESYQAILSQWLSRPGKRTHYWLLRVVRELGLSCAEAITLKPYTASLIRPGHLLIARSARRPPRAIPLDTDAKRELVSDVITFLDSVKRYRLGWPLDTAVRTNQLAETRLRNAIYYARDQVRQQVIPAVGEA